MPKFRAWLVEEIPDSQGDLFIIAGLDISKVAAGTPVWPDFGPRGPGVQPVGSVVGGAWHRYGPNKAPAICVDVDLNGLWGPSHSLTWAGTALQITPTALPGLCRVVDKAVISELVLTSCGVQTGQRLVALAPNSPPVWKSLWPQHPPPPGSSPGNHGTATSPPAAAAPDCARCSALAYKNKRCWQHA